MLSRQACPFGEKPKPAPTVGMNLAARSKTCLYTCIYGGGWLGEMGVEAMRWVDASSAHRTHGRTDLRGPLKCSESPAVHGSASKLLLRLTSTSRPRRRRALATVSPPMPAMFGGGWRLSPQSRLGATAARFDGSVRPIDRPTESHLSTYLHPPR